MQDVLIKDIANSTIKSIPTWRIDLTEKVNENPIRFNSHIPKEMQDFQRWFVIVKNLIVNNAKNIIDKTFVDKGFANDSSIAFLDDLIFKFKLNNSVVKAINNYDGICYVNDANKRFIYRFKNQNTQSEILLGEIISHGLDSKYMNLKCPSCGKKLNKHTRNFAYKLEGNKAVITCLPCAMNTNDLQTAKFIFGNFSCLMFSLSKLEQLNEKLAQEFSETNNFGKWFILNRFGLNMLLHFSKGMHMMNFTNKSFGGSDLDFEINRILEQVQKKRAVQFDNSLDDWLINFKKESMEKEVSNVEDNYGFIEALYNYQNVIIAKKFSIDDMSKALPNELRSKLIRKDY